MYPFSTCLLNKVCTHFYFILTDKCLDSTSRQVIFIAIFELKKIKRKAQLTKLGLVARVISAFLQNFMNLFTCKKTKTVLLWGSKLKYLLTLNTMNVMSSVYSMLFDSSQKKKGPITSPAENSFYSWALVHGYCLL